ncbi:MAG: hypothetical protein MUF70_13975, partial [Myxococcota bacterium]|nr:hypothetical protein [Myxococcota bacterium]
MNRRPGLVTLLVGIALALAAPARADLQQTVTFRFPSFPPPGSDFDSLLAPGANAFQEAGMHVESFWVKNTIPAFDPSGHTHVMFPNDWEQSHGFGQSAGLGPDRQGLYLRREDGGPFSLESVDLRLVQPAATNFMIGETYDPAFLAETQLTSFPLVASANFETLAPPGFENVTELFLAYDLTEEITDRGDIDNIVVSIPHGSCAQSVAGGVMLAHTGQADPATEGWTLEGAGTDVLEGPIGDGGVDAWTIDDASTAAGSLRSYGYAPPPDVMCWARNAGLRLRARVRIPDALDSPFDSSIFFSFTDSQRTHELRLGSSATGKPIARLNGFGVTLSALDSG